ncbi:MAG: NTPase [Nitrososphaerota archaeon]|nr:NTPase [Aigarchaeota archaeon]MDW8076894.1 NTPase [Nitrososphaerota archaeon]
MDGEKLFVLTGAPGSGKTTVVLRLVEILKNMGLSVGGMYTREVRSSGVRVGFEIVDVATGKVGTLAWTGCGPGPRVGKYVVNLRDLEEVGVKAIELASQFDVVVVDEVGPMELKSRKFKEAVRKLLAKGRPAVLTIHYRASDELLDEIRRLVGDRSIVVTFDNRDSLPMVLAEKIKGIVRGGA